MSRILTNVSETLAILSVGPNTDLVYRDSHRDILIVALYVRAGRLRSRRGKDRAATLLDHVQSSSHRGGCRVDHAGYSRQTLFPHPVRSTTKAQQSCVS